VKSSKQAASATKRSKFCETFATAPDIKPKKIKILRKEGERLNRKEDFLITQKKRGRRSGGETTTIAAFRVVSCIGLIIITEHFFCF